MNIDNDTYEKLLSNVFEKFINGEPFDDNELNMLIQETSSTINYFEARKDARIVLDSLYQDLYRLENIKRARKLD